jgi:hypothetical protein
MYNCHRASPFPLMTCLRFIRLAFAATLTLSAANCLRAQTTRASALKAGEIISLTQDPLNRQGSSSLDLINAGINQGVSLSVLAAPPLSDSSDSGQSEAGTGSRRGGSKNGTASTPPGSGSPAGKGPGRTTGSPTALLPGRSSGLRATGLSQRYFSLPATGQMATGGQFPGSSTITGHPTPGLMEPEPAVMSHRTASASSSQSAWNTADTSENGSSTAAESVDVSSSTSDQSPDESSSKTADKGTQQGLFEDFRDPLAGKFESAFEGFNATMEFDQTCGEACSLRSSAPPTGLGDFGGQDLGQSDQDSQDQDSTNTAAGFLGARDPFASLSTGTLLGKARSSKSRKPGLGGLPSHELPR